MSTDFKNFRDTKQTNVLMFGKQCGRRFYYDSFLDKHAQEEQ